MGNKNELFSPPHVFIMCGKFFLFLFSTNTPLWSLSHTHSHPFCSCCTQVRWTRLARPRRPHPVRPRRQNTAERRDVPAFPHGRFSLLPEVLTSLVTLFFFLSDITNDKAVVWGEKDDLYHNASKFIFLWKGVFISKPIEKFLGPPLFWLAPNPSL